MSVAILAQAKGSSGFYASACTGCVTHVGPSFSLSIGSHSSPILELRCHTNIVFTNELKGDDGQSAEATFGIVDQSVPYLPLCPTLLWASLLHCWIDGNMLNELLSCAPLSRFISWCLLQLVSRLMD